MAQNLQEQVILHASAPMIAVDHMPAINQSVQIWHLKLIGLLWWRELKEEQQFIQQIGH